MTLPKDSSLISRSTLIPGFHSRLITIKSMINTVISFFAARIFGLPSRLVGNMILLNTEQQNKLRSPLHHPLQDARILAFGANNSMQVYPSTFRARFDQQLKQWPNVSFARIQDTVIPELSLLAPPSSYPSSQEEQAAAQTQARLLAKKAKQLASSSSKSRAIECLAIPCGVKTLFGQHFVSLLINFKDQTIEYYDPQGIDPRQRKLVTFPHVTLENYLQTLLKELGSDKDAFTLKWQSGTHQHDTYNCVLYGTRFFEERMKGFSYEELMDRWNRESQEGHALESITRYRGELFERSFLSNVTST